MNTYLADIIASITAISKQRDEAQTKAMDLRDAARSFIDVLNHPFSESVRYCQRDRCHVVATFDIDGVALCDAHGLTVSGSRHELEYAPAWRALRAAADAP